MNNNFLIKGNLIYSGINKELNILPNGYAVCHDGICEGVFKQIPEDLKDFEIMMH